VMADSNVVDTVCLGVLLCFEGPCGHWGGAQFASFYGQCAFEKP
jgi:hypothetical protein